MDPLRSDKNKPTLDLPVSGPNVMGGKDDILTSILAKERTVPTLRRLGSAEIDFGRKSFSSYIKTERPRSATCSQKKMEYEVVCASRSTPGSPVWSVWKTAEEFLALDKMVRSIYPDLLKGLSFPANWLGDLLISLLRIDVLSSDAAFLGRLRAYWDALMAMDRLTDFDEAQDSCMAISVFLGYERQVSRYLQYCLAANLSPRGQRCVSPLHRSTTPSRSTTPVGRLPAGNEATSGMVAAFGEPGPLPLAALEVLGAEALALVWWEGLWSLAAVTRKLAVPPGEGERSSEEEGEEESGGKGQRWVADVVFPGGGGRAEGLVLGREALLLPPAPNAPPGLFQDPFAPGTEVLVRQGAWGAEEAVLVLAATVRGAAAPGEAYEVEYVDGAREAVGAGRLGLLAPPAAVRRRNRRRRGR